MEFVNTSFSFVILGESHNPSIINPDFLANNGIVDKNWEIDKNAPFLISPLQSTILYKTGIQFHLELNKLTIKDLVPDGDIFPLPDITSKYLEVLPHVNYSAIGVNFEKALIFKNMEDAEEFNFKFIKSINSNYPIKNAELKFVYQLKDGICNITLGGPGILQKNNKNNICIIVSCNIHRDFNSIKIQSDRLKSIQEVIKKWKKDEETFNNIFSSLIGE